MLTMEEYVTIVGFELDAPWLGPPSLAWVSECKARKCLSIEEVLLLYTNSLAHNKHLTLELNKKYIKIW